MGPGRYRRLFGRIDRGAEERPVAPVLQDHLHPPEFEWLRDALIRDCVPNWIEWHLALYRLMEQLGIHFLCQEGHFQMLDAAGKRLYFGVDHADAAEQMLMKILFPLNQ